MSTCLRELVCDLQSRPSIYMCTYSMVVTPPCSSMHFELWFDMFSWLAKIGAVHLSDLCTASARRVCAQLLFTFLHFVCGFHFIHVENSTQFKFDLEILGTQSGQYFFYIYYYCVKLWFTWTCLYSICFSSLAKCDWTDPISFWNIANTKKTILHSKRKKKRNNWFIPQIDAIPHCFSKVGKKHGSRVSFWHIWKSSQFRLNLSLPFCTNLFTQTHFHSFFSLVTNSYRTAWVCDILFKEFQSNGKKGIMSDEMDECACYWSHEFAMRRLLALVSIGIWIFCLIRWLMEKLIIIFSLPHFIVETRTGLLHWQWMHRS